MSKERARRRAERIAVLEKEKAVRARRVARRGARRQLVRRLTPAKRSSGVLMRRSRSQRIGIVLIPLIAAATIWILIPDLALRLVLLLLIALAVPALVVVVLGRKS
jgi:hypothetical protein